MLSLAATPLILVSAAAAAAAPRLETPLATLGGKVIREADFQRSLERAYPREEVEKIRRSASERQRALDEYLDSQAVVAKARRQGLDREERFKKALELMELKALAHGMTERHRDRILERARVSPQEVKAYYERHKAELVAEPRFTAHHLLVYVKGNPAFPEKGLGEAEARTKAEAALAELRAGKGWEAVAKAASDDVATSQRAGLIRDGQFGYFAPEVEQAVRTQEIGKPGEVVKSAFGYHVLQVQERVTEKAPEPFEKVKAMLTDRLSQERSAQARKAFMAPLAKEVGFRLREAGNRDAFLLDERALPPDAILAEIGGRKILESEFRWFINDALPPQQRMSAASRPGARLSMLGSYLDMRILEAKARELGLDKTPDFLRSRTAMEEELLFDFMLERDKATSVRSCGKGGEGQTAQREYFDRVRTEVGLKLAGQ